MGGYTACTSKGMMDWMKQPVCWPAGEKNLGLWELKSQQSHRPQRMNTFQTVEQGPRSSRLCSRRPQNEGLIPWTLPSPSWKTQPNWNQFQNKLPSDKGRELTSYCVVLTFKSAEIWWLFKEKLIFLSIGYKLFMDDDSEHKVNNSDDGWVPDSE